MYFKTLKASFRTNIESFFLLFFLRSISRCHNSSSYSLFQSFSNLKDQALGGELGIVLLLWYSQRRWGIGPPCSMDWRGRFRSREEGTRRIATEEEKPPRLWQRTRRSMTWSCALLAPWTPMARTISLRFSPREARKESTRIAALCGRYINQTFDIFFQSKKCLILC